jgi:signal transduction histidine kinase
MMGSNEVDDLLRSIRDSEARLLDLVGSERAEALLLREMQAIAARDQRYRGSLEKFAHDLSNVLAPVQMSSYLLRIHVNGGEGEEILTAMEESVNHGLDIVRQALALARNGGGGG